MFFVYAQVRDEQSGINKYLRYGRGCKTFQGAMRILSKCEKQGRHGYIEEYPRKIVHVSNVA